MPKALERIGGIQAQYAPSMYIGLWSRVEGFERDQLTRALERRKVAQGTSLRATIHLLTPADWWAFTIAIRERRRETWLRYHRDGPSAEQMVAAARRVRKRLAEGPVDRKELAGMIGFGPQGVTGITLGSTWCGYRPPAPGSAGGRIASATPRPGSARRPT